MSIIVPAIVLAAGQSSRMGRTKALLPTGRTGDTFVNRIVRTLREGGADDVLVVVNADGQDIASALQREQSPPRLILNPQPKLGQMSSLQAGLRAIDHPGIGGILVTLVDVPLIRASTVRVLLDAHRSTRAPIVRPVRRGSHGHPVIFDRSVFKQLRHAPPDSSAKVIIKAHLREVVDVAVEEDGHFSDIDTPADYERVFKRTLAEDSDGKAS